MHFNWVKSLKILFLSIYDLSKETGMVNFLIHHTSFHVYGSYNRCSMLMSLWHHQSYRLVIEKKMFDGGQEIFIHTFYLLNYVPQTPYRILQRTNKLSNSNPGEKRMLLIIPYILSIKMSSSYCSLSSIVILNVTVQNRICIRPTHMILYYLQCRIDTTNFVILGECDSCDSSWESSEFILFEIENLQGLNNK